MSTSSAIVVVVIHGVTIQRQRYSWVTRAGTNSEPRMIAITESWTHPNIANSYLHIPNCYIAARHDRNYTQNGRGGGILIYVHDQLKSVETTSQSAFIQYASQQIPLTQKDSLFFYVFYCSQNSTSSWSIGLKVLKLGFLLTHAPLSFNHRALTWEKTFVFFFCPGTSYMECSLTSCTPIEIC